MFDAHAHFYQAVAQNLVYWRHTLLLTGAQTDRWQPQHDTIYEAIRAGLAHPPTQLAAAALCADLFPIMERWGFWSTWQPLIATANTMVAETDALFVRLLIWHGRIDFLNRNFTDAVATHQKALAAAHSSDHLTASALYALTNDFMGCQDYAQAEAYGLQALQLLPEDSDMALTASIYNSLGLIAMARGAFPVGIAHFERAATIWQGLSQSTQLARCFTNLAVAYQRQQALDIAGQYYQRAGELLAGTGSDIDELKVWNGLGTLYHMRGELAEAEAVFRAGLQVAAGLRGVFHLRGSLMHNLGNTLLENGRYLEAELYLGKSLQLWQQASDNLQRANSTGTLGELYEKRAVWETAVAYYQEALVMLAAYPDHQWANHLAETFRTAKERCAAHLTADKST